MRVVIGKGSCGIAAGANKVSDAAQAYIDANHLNMTVGVTGCIGMCYLEPIVDVYDDQGGKTTYVRVNSENIKDILDAAAKDTVAEAYTISEEDTDILNKQTRIALRNCGIIDPENIDDYISRGGYKALEKCIHNMSGSEVIDVIKVSGLAGRGGAGFPTWFKWNAARSARNVKK